VRPGLRIGLLGPLTVNGRPGAVVPAQSQLIVALAVSQDGLSGGQLRTLLGSDASHPRPAGSFRQLIARTRRALDRTADGSQWIEHVGHGRYRLHPHVWVDWREFEAAAAAGIRLADAGLLADALDLVHGQPFADCYYWWLEPALIESVTARIVTAAERLAELRLASGDPVGAVRAARIGLVADAAAERLWRLVMRGEHAAGNLAGVRGAWERCQGVVAEIAADGKPEPVTAAIYAELLARRT